MSYPGDEQQPGGWSPSRPPHSPYGPVDDQAEYEETVYDEPPAGGRYEDPQNDPYGGPPHGRGPGGPFGPGGPGGPSGGPRETEHAPPYGGGFGSEPDPYGPRNGPPRGEPFVSGYGPAFGAEPPEPYGGGNGPYDPEPGEEGSGSGRKRLVIGAAAVAAVVVIGGGTALALTSGGDDKAKPTAAAPTSAPPATPTVNPTPTPTETGRGDRLKTRTTDPKPLTLNEVFKARSFKSGSRRYVMTARRAERKCAPPTHGTSFRKTLAKAGCTQVLRATFANGKFVGTIGVLNLRTETAAAAVKTASNQRDAFILALPGAGSTRKIGQGLSLTTAEVDGHYLIMSWVQYPNGKRIAKGDYAAVSSFVRSTTYGSNLRTALNYRSMEGKPS